MISAKAIRGLTMRRVLVLLFALGLLVVCLLPTFFPQPQDSATTTMAVDTPIPIIKPPEVPTSTGNATILLSAEQKADFFPVDTIRKDQAADTTKYDHFNTLFAINLFYASLSNVIASKDRVALQQEYDNVLNNLLIENIKPDDEILAICKQYLDIINNKLLRQDEHERFLRLFERRRKQALWKAVGGVRAYGGDPYSFVLSLVQNSVSAYFSYSDLKTEMEEELENELWELRNDESDDLNDARTTFLKSAWALIWKYFEDDQSENRTDWRLTEKTIGGFLDAINRADKQESFRLLEAMKENFEAYPPFWFYYGLAAQECGNVPLAIKCYNTFEKIHRPVLKKDPFFARVCLNKARLLFEPSARPEELKLEMEPLLKVAEDHTDVKTEGMTFLGIAMLYAQLDNGYEATRLLQQNIDNHSEVSAARIALENLKSGRPIQQGVPELLGVLVATDSPGSKLEGLDDIAIQELAERNVPEAQYLLAIRKERSNAVAESEVLKLLTLAADQGYLLAQNEIGRRCLGRGDYDCAYTWFTESAKQGDAIGHWGLGVCYRDGGDKYIDVTKSADHFKRAADLGEPEAMYEFGMASLNGKGLPKNLNDAKTWLETSAREGFLEAQCELGKRLLDDELEPKQDQGSDKEDARRVQGIDWLRKAAESGEADAIDLYWHYARQDNVKSAFPDEPSVALNLARRFANEKKDPHLQFLLGKYYHKESEFEEAEKWLQLAENGTGDYAAAAFVYRFVRNEQSFNEDCLRVCPRSDKPAVKNVRNSYAQGIDDNTQILLIYDPTWGTEWSEGCCLTASKAFSSELGNSNGIYLRDIGSVHVINHMNWDNAWWPVPIVSLAYGAIAGCDWIYLDEYPFVKCEGGLDSGKLRDLIAHLVELAKKS